MQFIRDGVLRALRYENAKNRHGKDTLRPEKIKMLHSVAQLKRQNGGVPGNYTV